MAYIKYKELTRYFNFDRELDINSLPKYVTDYVKENEIIYAAYATNKDKIVVTDQKLIIFEVYGVFSKARRIHFFPFRTISSSAIEFYGPKVAFLLSMDSGYQLRFNFIKMSPESKTKIRLVYMHIVDGISSKIR